MKKIAVIGLGIIGGSICASLTKAGCVVDGADLNSASVDFALQKGYIAKEAKDFTEYDVVFIAIPPRAAISVLKETAFKEGALVSDICGVKKIIEDAVYERPRNYRYVGIHPMAGKETSGIASASPELFRMANLVITICSQTKTDAIAEIKEYANVMHFGKIVECTAEEHDKKIALTSQLAHLVSNGYVKSEQVKGCDGFTGGSFQDMTRIAGVDERIWTELYMCNRESVLYELEGLIQSLNEYKIALEQADEQRLSDALKAGRLIRETIKRGK
jgi:prephenate dehydrogenase